MQKHEHAQRQKQPSSAKLKMNAHSTGMVGFFFPHSFCQKGVHDHEFGAGLCSSNQIFFFKYLCIEILGFFRLEVSPVQNCSRPEN